MVTMREYVLATFCMSVLVFVAFFGAYNGTAWREPSVPALQPYNTTAGGNQKNFEGKTPKWENPDSFWEKTRSDPVAYFTYILAIFTTVLGSVSIIQIGFLIRSDRTARIAANAANLNAQAAIGAELPIISLSSISLLREQSGLAVNVVGYPGKESALRIDFKNFGRSPAELICTCIELAVVDKLPSIPAYKTTSPWRPGIFIEPEKTIPTGPIMVKIILLDEEVTAISDETKFLWVFGYLSFRDSIKGKVHSYRFCTRWQAYAALEEGELSAIGFVHSGDTPSVYIEKG